MVKLDAGQKHVLKLIHRDQDKDGYTAVSDLLYRILAENIPRSLATFEKLNVGGRVKLTPEGKNVVLAMEWLCD